MLQLASKTAVEHFGCAFAYFVADTKIICGFNFVAPLKVFK